MDDVKDLLVQPPNPKGYKLSQPIITIDPTLNEPAGWPCHLSIPRKAISLVRILLS
jgi:hypothetical protein